MKKTNSNQALGRGLEQLFSNAQVDFDNFEKEIISTAKDSDIKMIPLDEIRSNPYQPRTHFDEESLKELSISIKEHGVFEPIIVKKSIKGYEIVAGERRTKASLLAGLTEIPAIIKDFDDEQMMEIAIIENIQREDLSPIDEARAFKAYMDKTKKTHEEVAQRFGKSRAYITNLVGILNLPEDIQEYVKEGKISMSHARILSKFSDETAIRTLAKKVVDDYISVRELENISQSGDIKKKKPIKTNTTLTTRHKIYENSLRELVGTKANISSNKIVIPYDTVNDLDRIMEILNVEIGE